MNPPIRFLTTRDGVRIAYCLHGEGPPLVFVRGWISHLELLWEDSAFRSYLEALACHYRVVRYDSRGNGLSDQKVGEIDLDALVLDLETVMDGLSLTDVVLYGATFGGPIAITYTVRHPERVARLILDGTYTRGREVTTPERQAAVIATLRNLPEAGFLLVSHLSHPDPHQTAYRRPEQTRKAISPEVAVQLYSLGFRIDLSDLLSQLQVSTLVLHRRGSRSIPFQLGRELASRIPNARFAALSGTAHNSWEGDASAALAAVGEFLGVPLELLPAKGTGEGRAPLTILFTDMESSTALTQRLGDAKVQELIRAHNTIVRDALRAYGGSEVKHTGDGIMASFPSASRAIECAIAIQRAIAEWNTGVGAGFKPAPTQEIHVRIGLNAGEPVAEEGDLYGVAVQLAARVCGHAQPGEILASDVVRQLAAGKGFQFTERGRFLLKGFRERFRLFAVSY